MKKRLRVSGTVSKKVLENVRREVKRSSKALKVVPKGEIFVTSSRKKGIEEVKKIAGIYWKHLEKEKGVKEMVKEIMAFNKEINLIENSNFPTYFIDSFSGKGVIILGKAFGRKEQVYVESKHVAYGMLRRKTALIQSSGIAEFFDISEQYMRKKGRDRRKIAEKAVAAYTMFLEHVENKGAFWDPNKQFPHFAAYAVLGSAISSGIYKTKDLKSLDLLVSRTNFLTIPRAEKWIQRISISKEGIRRFSTEGMQEFGAMKMIEQIGKKMEKDPAFLQNLVKKMEVKGIIKEE